MASVRHNKYTDEIQTLYHGQVVQISSQCTKVYNKHGKCCTI